jgi:2-phosphoglycerate kinase
MKKHFMNAIEDYLAFENQSLLPDSTDTVKKIRDLLDKIKPTNLIPLFSEFCRASHARRAAVLVSIAELLGVYWKGIEDYSNLFFKGILLLRDYFPSLLGSAVKTGDEFENQSVTINETGFCRTVIDFLKDSCGVKEALLNVIASPVIVLVGFVSMLGLGSGVLTGDMYGVFGAQVVKGFNMLGTLAKSWKEVITGPNSLLTTIMSAAGGIFGFTWEDAHSEKRRLLITRIEKKLASMKEITDQVRIHIPMLLGQPGFFRGLEKEIKEMDDIYVDLAKKTENLGNARSLLDRLRQQFEKLEGLRESLLSSIAGKQEPTVIWLAGDPGVGKSTIAGKLIQALSVIENRQLLTYTRSIASEYWSGYIGQDVVVYDDFGSAQQDKDSQELIHIFSPSAWPVNMAALSEKKTLFCSRYVIICSNQVDIAHSATITTPVALQRRRDLLYKCELNRQFIKLDANGVPYTNPNVDQIDHQPDCSHVEFRLLERCDPGRGIRRQIGVDPDIPTIAQKMYDIQKQRCSDFYKTCDAALTAFSNQSLEDDLDSNIDIDPNLFAELEVRESNVFLLVGPPGVGKTTLARSVKGAIIHDEFCDRFESIRTAILEIADADAPPTFLTCNETDLKKLKKNYAEDQWTAFMRRCHIIQYYWRSKSFFNDYDLTDIAKGVPRAVAIGMKMLTRGSTTYKSIGDQHVIELLKNAKKKVVRSYVDVPRAHIKDAEFVLQINLKVRELLSHEIKLTDIFTKVKFLKGNPSVHLLSKIAEIKTKYPKTTQLEGFVSALISLNNTRIDATGFPRTTILHCADESVWVVPVAGKLVFGLHQAAQVVKKDGEFVFKDTETPLTDSDTIAFYKALSDFMTFDIDGTQALAYAAIGATIPPLGKAWEMLDIGLLCLQIGISALSIYARIGDTAEAKPDFFGPESADRKTVGEKPIPHPKQGPVIQEVKWKENPNWITGMNWADAFEEEAGGDPGARLVESVILKNLVEIISPTGNVLCYGVGVRDRKVLTVAHVGHTIMVRTRNKGVFSCKPIKEDAYRDLMLLELPPQAQMFADITCHLPSKDEQHLKQGTTCTLLTIDPNRELVRAQPVEIEQPMVIPIQGAPRRGVIYKQLSGVTHSTPLGTQKGDCGGPIIAHDTKCKNKFIALHSAGNTHLGLGAIVYKEFLDDCFDNESRPLPPIVSLDYQGVALTEEKKCTAEGWEYMTKVGLAGYLDKKNGNFSPLSNKSRAVQTQLWKLPFEDIPIEGNKYLPSVLSHKDKRLKKDPDYSPYEWALTRYSRPQPKIDIPLLDLAAHDIGSLLLRELKKKRKFLKVLTKKEALNGTSTLDSSHPLWRKSSPGFPFTHWKEFAGGDKGSALIQGEDGLWRFSPTTGKKVETCVNQLIDACRQPSIKPACVFQASLKDELLAEKKIEEGRTRSFAASPFDYTIAHRMYFHSFGAALVDVGAHIPIKVGMNAASYDFAALYSYLVRTGQRGFDSDFKFWDASVPREVLERVLTITNRCFRELDPNWTEEDQIIRNNLFNVLLEPLLLIYDDVVKCPGGVVSGQPHTAIDNSIVNCLYYYYAWLVLTRERKPEWHNFYSFEKHVSFAVYGDDNLCGISSEAEELFNFGTFEKVMQSLGLEMTPADKDAEKSGNLKPVWDLQFLKRTFQLTNGVVVGAIDKNSLRKMCAYSNFGTRRKAWEMDEVRYDKAIITMIVSSALSEATLIGEDFYMNLYSYFSKKSVEYGFDMPILAPYIIHFRRVYYGEDTTATGIPVAQMLNKSFPEGAKENCTKCSKKFSECACYCLSCGFTRQNCYCTRMSLCSNCSKPYSGCVCCPICKSSSICNCFHNQSTTPCSQSFQFSPGVCSSQYVTLPGQPDARRDDSTSTISTGSFHNSDADSIILDGYQKPPNSPDPSDSAWSIDTCYSERPIQPGTSLLHSYTLPDIPVKNGRILAGHGTRVSPLLCEGSTPRSWLQCVPCCCGGDSDDDSTIEGFATWDNQEDQSPRSISDGHICLRFTPGCFCLLCSSPWENQSSTTAPAVPSSSVDGTIVPCDGVQSTIPEATTAVAPMGTADVVAPAAAAANIIDPWFYEHFVHLTRFTWSTTQPPGTLLWSSPITPDFAHPNLAYVSRLYNVWAGGLDYNIKVAGTGFHAGALAIVRLPPNIPPSSIQSASEFTYFDYAMIDPKHLDVVSKSVCDQRRFLYHYRDGDSVNNKDSIGGYIAIYVLLQLNTSSSGTNQIDIEVLNKAAADFFPAQMRPVDLALESNDFPELIDALNTVLPRDFMGSNYDNLVVDGSTTLSSSFTTNVAGVDNSIPAPPPFLTVLDNIYPCNAWRCVSNAANTSTTLTSVIKYDPAWTKFIQTHALPALAPNIESQYGDKVTPSCAILLQKDGKTVGPVTLAGRATNLWFLDPITVTIAGPLETIWTYPISCHVEVVNSDLDRVVVPVPGERFLMWSATNPINPGLTNRILQTYNVTLRFRASALGFGPQTAILLSLVDRQTEQPVFDCKLYYEGFITCKGPANTHFPLTSVKFKFQGVVARNTVLANPSTPAILAKLIDQWQSLQKERDQHLAWGRERFKDWVPPSSTE